MLPGVVSRTGVARTTCVTVWRGASGAWGRSLRESIPVNWDTPQNLRFQGSTWTAKPACTTISAATTTRRAGVIHR